MKMFALKCKKCKNIIYSRAGHDFRWCGCGAIAIDGGFNYVHITGDPENMEELTLEVKATKEQLYDDWNTSKDKFGLIAIRKSRKKKKNGSSNI